MKKELTETELQEIESQLHCPTGSKGIEMGKTMNETNIGMTLNTIKFLDIQDQHSVLEFGHGNCGHLSKLMAVAKDISYHGLEISEAMFDQAQRVNQDIISDKPIEFQLYDGETIPFQDNTFDRGMSVNTIYFCSNPVKLLDEIARVLKPNGYFVLTFAQKDFMKALPFIGDKFTLYDTESMQDLVNSSNIAWVQIADETEQVKNKAGDWVERRYSMVKLTKASK